VRVSWFSLKTKVNGFSQFGIKTGGYDVSGFDLKTSGYGSSGLASKPLSRVSWFGPQNRQLWFGDLAQKITMTIS
jgi:hypothetical protein